MSKRQPLECPVDACGHNAEDHGLLSPLCDVEDCNCGMSDVHDHRTREALAGRGWTISPEEYTRRGLTV